MPVRPSENRAGPSTHTTATQAAGTPTAHFKRTVAIGSHVGSLLYSFSVRPGEGTGEAVGRPFVEVTGTLVAYLAHAHALAVGNVFLDAGQSAILILMGPDSLA